MKVVVITRPGGPEVFELAERPLPVPRGRQIRVRVRASALNRADLLQRRGRYPAPPGHPQDIPGLEYAGEVDALGEAATLWEAGSRVMGITGGGTHAEYVCVHEEEAIPVPASFSWTEAGAIPEVFLTAYDALFRQGEMESGERVLIHAVGSGVGTAALQLVRASGGVGFGSSRTPGKLDAAVALGLPYPIDATGDWVAEIDSLTESAGVSLILDLVGGDYLNGNLRAVSERGRIVVVGTLAGPRTEIDLGLLLRKRARLIGTVLRSRSHEEKAALARDFETAVLPRFASGELSAVIDRSYPFEEIVDAHRRLEENASFGKVVLLW